MSKVILNDAFILKGKEGNYVLRLVNKYDKKELVNPIAIDGSDSHNESDNYENYKFFVMKESGIEFTFLEEELVSTVYRAHDRYGSNSHLGTTAGINIIKNFGFNKFYEDFPLIRNLEFLKDEELDIDNWDIDIIHESKINIANFIRYYKEAFSKNKSEIVRFEYNHEYYYSFSFFTMTKIFKTNRYFDDVLKGMIISGSFPAAINLYLLSEFYTKNNIDMYSYFEIKQDNGKIREIYDPKDDIKRCCKELNAIISSGYESKLRYSEIGHLVYGYRKKKNIQMNAKVHSKNKKVIKLDISDFFHNCRFSDFNKTIRFLHSPSKGDRHANYRYMNSMRDVLINPKTGGLYMGNPLSGTLSNLIMVKVIKYIKNMLKDKDIAFTIYADDMTFSGDSKNEFLNKKYLEYIVNHAFDTFGLKFKIKEEKTVFMRNQKRRITGITINHNNEITWNRSIYREFRAIFHLLDNGKTLSELNINKNELKGRLSFFRYSDETGKINRLIEKYNDTLLKHNLIKNCDGEEVSVDVL